MSMYINFPESKMTVIGKENVPMPDMVRINQIYDNKKVEDVAAKMRAEMEALPDHDSYKGKSICITAGSRGIPDLDVMIRTICDVLKEWGAEPFIIPAMGSHAGGIAEGQKEMIAGYNITEESMGVPIKASMEVVQYGEYNGIPLYCDKYAMESDGIVLFNKVKPHTDFRGPHESGLAKMIAIGIAKHKGCANFHSFGFERFAELIPPVAEIFLEKCPVAFGVGVVQNAYDDICTIKACTKDKIMETDAELLVEAKEKLAKFKFHHIDLLIIDEIGKNISGNGHDPNVTGRNITKSFGKEVLDLDKLFIRGITPEAHHNGCGLAEADITTRRVLNDVDWDVTWTNGMTTGCMQAGEIPVYANNDKEAIQIALRCLHNVDLNKAMVVHIKNTLEMSEIEVSTGLYETIKDRDDIKLVRGPVKMAFDENDNLIESF